MKRSEILEYISLAIEDGEVRIPYMPGTDAWSGETIFFFETTDGQRHKIEISEDTRP